MLNESVLVTYAICDESKHLKSVVLIKVYGCEGLSRNFPVGDMKCHELIDANYPSCAYEKLSQDHFPKYEFTECPSVREVISKVFQRCIDKGKILNLDGKINVYGFGITAHGDPVHNFVKKLCPSYYCCDKVNDKEPYEEEIKNVEENRNMGNDYDNVYIRFSL